MKKLFDILFFSIVILLIIAFGFAFTGCSDIQLARNEVCKYGDDIINLVHYVCTDSVSGNPLSSQQALDSLTVIWKKVQK